jgi:hypothetical protein
MWARSRCKGILLFSIVSVLLFTHCPSEAKPFLTLRSTENAGMFSVFFNVLGGLDHYEKGNCEGIEVNFLQTGLYFDTAKGPDWWSYYFEPVCEGQKNDDNEIIVTENHVLCSNLDVEYHMTRARAHELITKYIHVKSALLQEVEKFVRSYFRKHPVIGVHYRGTDKFQEAPRARYEVIRQQVNLHLQKNGRIFVATDEQQFLDYMIHTYGNQVIYQANAKRSRDHTPLHLHAKSPYQQGKEALIDCLLLARTDLLIRTSSNLSLASSFFNPDLPVIEVTKRVRP